MKKDVAGGAALALAACLGLQQAVAFEFPKFGMPQFLGGNKGQTTGPGATPDCPVIVAEDAQMLRSPAGAEGAAVHHQVSIKDIARECVVEGDHIVIRVGVEGDAMLGPAGAPGSYGGTLRIALRKISDESILSSKNYHINTAISAGASRADFRLLSDPIAAPPSAKPQEDYEILVGFAEGSANAADDKPQRGKKKGRR